MNYRETIVYNDLKEMGYEVLLNEETGYPDFKVIDLKKKEMFYVEVKSLSKAYKSSWKRVVSEFSGKQKEIFERLVKEGIKVLIAIPSDGILKYEYFKDKKMWRQVTYAGKKVVVKYSECNQCKYTWMPRKQNPKQCPNCKRMDWNEVKK